MIMSRIILIHGQKCSRNAFKAAYIQELLGGRTGCPQKIDTVKIICVHGTCRNVPENLMWKLSSITRFQKIL